MPGIKGLNHHGTGVCVECGAPVPDKGLRCTPCREVRRLARMRANAKARQAKRKAKGVCAQCGVPVKDGQTRCVKHRMQVANNSAAYHALYDELMRTIPLRVRDRWFYEDLWGCETPLHLLPVDELLIRIEDGVL